MDATYEVCVSAGFCATHALRLPDGNFEPLHGHDWRVSVTLAGRRLGPTGLLIDFHALRGRLETLCRELDRGHLNEQPAFRELPPSAENVARWFARRIGADLPAGLRVARVEVEEAPGCVAAFVPAEKPTG